MSSLKGSSASCTTLSAKSSSRRQCLCAASRTVAQMLDDFGCESQVDPRQQRQERRQGQMVTFAKRLEKRLHKLYRVPESLPSLACKLRYAKEQCGMPLPLFEVANRTRQWRNISAHVTREELPETDEELVAVWGRILHLLKVEEKRLHGY